MKTPRPKVREKVKWTGPITKNTFNVIVSKVRVRDKTAKIVPDYSSGDTMPYPYFWVDFNEIGY